VDNDLNLAAWMIGGGRTVDPAEARNATHRRALAARLTKGASRPGFVGRLAATTLSTLRPDPAPVEAACCPA
jgi:hypothetical protein